MRLRRSVMRLHRRLRHSALGGVSPAQASMLGTIEKLERPSLGELAAEEQVQPPSVTRIVRALEDRGLVRLVTDAEDRRCTRATLTAAGRREIGVIRERRTEYLAQRLHALDGVSRAKAAELVALLERLAGDE